MGKIFGGSKSKSTSTSTQSSSSSNRAYDQISNGISSNAFNAYNTATNQLNQELGSGWDGYRENTSFDFMRALGLDRTAGNYSGRGIFNSGATLKGLSEYNNAISNQYYTNYLAQLQQQAQLGLGGAQLLAGTGNVSSSTGSSSGTSTSRSSPGLGGFFGGIASGIGAS